MQQVISTWLNMDSRKRLVATVSALVMFAAMLGVFKLAFTPSKSLLFSGLDAGSAGEVVQALEQAGVSFEVRQNSIFVASGRRDELRMTLATQGLPANSSQGYELLDSLNGFGTTAQMFDATYLRAKEGELARTILSSPIIQAARVHISVPKSSGFRKSADPTASVTITGTGGALPTALANALKYLVASAVAGLRPENVAIIDGRNGLMISTDDATGAGNAGDRAAEMKANVENLLQARVGAGKVVVELRIETETETESIVERRFDPEGRVTISSETEERSTSSNEARAGSVTVASNLPDGDQAGADNNSNSQNSETRERLNYEVSETTRELRRNPGAIRRVSVAVLLDGVSEADPQTGEIIWSPRPEEEMAALQELVKSAVGFDEARGDVVTLRTLEFEAPTPLGTAATATLIQRLNLDVMQLIQLGALGLVSLIMGLFVFRPLFATLPASGPSQLAAPQLASAPPGRGAQMDDKPPVLTPAPPPGPALTGEIDDTPFVPQDANGTPGFLNASQQQALSSDPVQRLRQMISNRQDETIDVLRTWMDEKEENV